MEYNNYTKVVLADGSIFHVRNGGCYDIIYDTNGDRAPNALGRDKFFFVICPSNTLRTCSLNGQAFAAYCAKVFCNTREKAIDQCIKNNANCAGILQIDNWEIKDDYPIRL